MIKKIGLVVLLSASVLFLCSCTSEEEISEKDEGVIAQYIAGSILKYDANYEDDLSYPYQRVNKNEEESDLHNKSTSIQPIKIAIEADETKEMEESVDKTISLNQDNNDKEKQEVTYTTLSNLYGKKDIAVGYYDYKLVKSYSGKWSSESFNMEANPGCKLLVIRFKMTNKSKNASQLNLTKSGVTYEVSSKGKTYYPTLSIIPNDIQYMDTTLQASRSASAVLVVEVPSDFVVDHTTLTITKGKSVSQVELK